MRLSRWRFAAPLSVLIALVLPAPVLPSGARSLQGVKTWAAYYGADPRSAPDLSGRWRTGGPASARASR